ncbi:hypothetical protein K7957_17695 [Sphingomonas yunnanensis]|nr:hypothetical protein [Sphingomonas yunnanensis]MBY9064774.1 hypothetical protein [Sphingomonas yunnanensis]
MPRGPGRYAAKRLLVAIALGLVPVIAVLLVFKDSAHDPTLTEHNHQVDD